MDDYLVEEIIDLYPPLLQAIDESGQPVAEQLASTEDWVWIGREIVQTKPVIFYFDHEATITSVVINYGDGDYDHVNIDPIDVVNGDAISFTMKIKSHDDG